MARPSRTVLHIVAAAVVWSSGLIVYRELGPRACGDAATCALGRLRIYAEAQEAYRARCGRYGTLTELVAAGEPVLDAQGVAYGYDYEFRVTAGGQAYAASATPVPGDPAVEALDAEWYVSVSSGRGLQWSVGHPPGEGDRRFAR